MKKTIKYFIILIFLVFASSTAMQAQETSTDTVAVVAKGRPYYWVLRVSADPSMAINGPYYERLGYADPGFNYEVNFGFEQRKYAVMLGYEEFNKINYSEVNLSAYWKGNDFIDHTIMFLFPKFDAKKLPGIIRWIGNLDGYIGPEVLWITREHPNATYSQPNNYIKTEKTRMLLGVRAGLECNLFGKLDAFVEATLEEAEASLEGKDSRFGVKAGLKLRF
ncbi:hypothetical protein KC901_01775 [Patescibacteria group bacterium]|nr:hypothetical protein [Patescibacteria group bacterium]